MIRKFIIMAAVTGAMAAASPALATGWGGWGGWGKPGSSSSSGGKGSSTSSGGSSGGQSTSSGGHKVPEPGMLGILGASLLGLGYARRRAAKRR